MFRRLAVASVFIGLVNLEAQDSSTKLLDEAGRVLTEIQSNPDKGIPQDLLNQAQCIGIVPSLKGAGFVEGAKYGKGVLTCRTTRGWSAPSLIRVQGGSFGLQIGAAETDVVFLVMNRSGKEKLISNRFTFGGDVSVAAGPVGRSAESQTDAKMHAEILLYSRARGVFAGITLDGSTVRPDKEENAALYGHPVSEGEILAGEVEPKASSWQQSVLNRYLRGFQEGPLPPVPPRPKE